MRRRRVILIASAVVLLGVAALLVFRATDQPQYKGRVLSDWVIDCGLWYTTADSRAYEAATPMKSIGSNAVPYLLKWIRDYRSPPLWQQYLRESINRICAKTGLPFSWRDNSILLHVGAFHAFQLLGPTAEAAIPELARMAKENSEADALEALSHLGPNAVGPLLAIATNYDSPLGGRAIRAIPNLGTNVNRALPSLLYCLREGDGRVSAAAAEVLGQLRLEPDIVIPALQRASEDERGVVRGAARTALQGYSIPRGTNLFQGR